MSHIPHNRYPSVDEKAALAGTSGTPGTSNPYITDDDPRLTGTGGVISVVAAVTVFGSGRDGNLTFNGSAVTGFSLSGSTYTRTAKSDLHADSVTISDNYSLDMAGFRFRAFEVTAGNNCAIHNDGSSSASTTAGAGAAPAAAATTTTGAIFYGGGIGGAGGSTATAAGVNGSAPATISSQIRYGGLGGSGGKGYYGGTTRTGGSGGPVTLNGSSAYHYYGDPWEILLGSFPYSRNGTAIAQALGGSGGGSGGRQNSTGTTTIQGAPGGGGLMGVAIMSLTCGTNFRISCNGGSVSTANTITGNAGAGGCGAGGGGGLAVIIGELNGTNLPSFEAKGGNAGNGISFGAGYGEGGYGGNGGLCLVYIGTNYVGGTPTCTAAGGTAGTNQDTGSVNPTWANTAGTAGTASYYQGATG